MLLLGDWERSHELSQDNPSREGSYWHAIAHRIEPDLKPVIEFAVLDSIRSSANYISAPLEFSNGRLPVAGS